MEHQDSHTREETGAGLVAPGYFDYQGRWQDVPWEQRRALFAAMGVRGDSEADVQRDLAAREDDQWRRWLPPVCVRVRSAASIDIPITLPAKESERDYAWRVTLENGERLEGRCRPAQLRTVAERSVGGDLHRQFALTLPDRIPLGYHRVELRSGPRSEASQLIVAPERCFEPPAVAADRRVWGFAVQLYALRSSRNWGIGDLSDLRELMDIAAEAGAGLVGISPVHALFIRNPHSASPYNPSSRLFGNVLLLDVEAIPDYVASEAAPDLADQEFRDRLESLRRGELIEDACVRGGLPPFPGVRARRRFASRPPVPVVSGGAGRAAAAALPVRGAAGKVSPRIAGDLGMAGVAGAVPRPGLACGAPLRVRPRGPSGLPCLSAVAIRAAAGSGGRAGPVARARDRSVPGSGRRCRQRGRRDVERSIALCAHRAGRRAAGHVQPERTELGIAA